MKKIGLLLFLTLTIMACGGGGGGGDDATMDISHPNLQVLAKNVITSSADAAASTNLDPDIQVYASNVVYDNSNSTLEATNAQDALDELSVGLNFATTMIGSWTIVNKNQDDAYEATGAVRINADGTFNLTEGSFAAIGQAASGFCAGEETSGTYEFFTDKLAVFSHDVNYPHNNMAEVIPTLVELKQNKIILIGSGGCGASTRQRISILTRAP